jgi:hypothetical protein
MLSGLCLCGTHGLYAAAAVGGVVAAAKLAAWAQRQVLRNGTWRSKRCIETCTVLNGGSVVTRRSRDVGAPSRVLIKARVALRRVLGWGAGTTQVKAVLHHRHGITLATSTLNSATKYGCSIGCRRRWKMPWCHDGILLFPRALSPVLSRARPAAHRTSRTLGLGRNAMASSTAIVLKNPMRLTMCILGRLRGASWSGASGRFGVFARRPIIRGSHQC